MAQYLHRIQRFITEATAAGVHPDHLAGFRHTVDQAHQLDGLFTTITQRDPITDILTTGKGDLEAAVRADAENTAMLERIRERLGTLTTSEDRIARGILADDQTVDNILSDLATTLSTALKALAPVTERWGESPDPARVAAEATPAELKAYRNRTEHQAARDRVHSLAAQLVTMTHSSVTTFSVLTIPKDHKHGGKLAAWRWLFHDDGTARTILEARRRVNALNALTEITHHQQRTTHPFPKYVPTFAVHPDALDAASFRRDGRPTEDVTLLEDETFRELFATPVSAGDEVKAKAYRDRLVEATA